MTLNLVKQQRLTLTLPQKQTHVFIKTYMIGAGERAYSVKGLTHKHDGLRAISRTYGKTQHGGEPFETQHWGGRVRGSLGLADQPA